jgi:hypothetical protein
MALRSLWEHQLLPAQKTDAHGLLFITKHPCGVVFRLMDTQIPIISRIVMPRWMDLVYHLLILSMRMDCFLLHKPLHKPSLLDTIKLIPFLFQCIYSIFCSWMGALPTCFIIIPSLIIPQFRQKFPNRIGMIFLKIYLLSK